MLVFLDETFRTNPATGERFGALCGIAIPEARFAHFQNQVYHIRRPFHGLVLKEEAELKGTQLLRSVTFSERSKKGFSYHWNLVEDLLQYCRSERFPVFGVVCFNAKFSSFICDSEHKLDLTFRSLFERIDLYMKLHHVGRFAKLVFDNRDHQTHEKNARSITNFFTRSAIGTGYDSIVRVPFFAVSQGHNYGLQMADIVTTVIGLHFQGDSRVDPLWDIVSRKMILPQVIDGRAMSTLKVIK